jgi:hypothetical protein
MAQVPYGVQPSQEQPQLFCSTPGQAVPVVYTSLVASNYYFFLPSGLLSPAVASPLATTYAAFAALAPQPLVFGNGLWTFPVGADENPFRGLLINVAFGAWTTAAGVSVGVMALLPPPFAAATDNAAYGLFGQAITPPANGQIFIPSPAGSAGFASAGVIANASVPGYLGVYITATTWPTAGATLAIEARIVF